ncbi:MAG: glycosyltransferase [Actinomycetota bacterium]|nr:glycosyltransferase [Actinomycetota bacterium]
MINEGRLHIVFVISSLGRGGSERQMINLAAELNRRGHRAEIAVLVNEGPMADEARSAGVPVLVMSRAGRSFSSLLALLRYVRRARPDIVHPYLPRDNALLTLGKPFLRKTRLVWGIRSADVDWTRYGRGTSGYWKVVKLASRWADLIVANSQFGATVHTNQGFPASKIVVVPNGVDTTTFRPRTQSRSEEHASLGIPDDCEVVGMLGRFDPMKGHDLILDVFYTARRQRSNLHLVVVGLHTPQQNQEFVSRARTLGLSADVTLRPESDSPEKALELFNALVLPSHSEGFPNVVAEALSCGVPVAAFDVGDVRQIIGPFGSVVPRGDADELGNAILRVLDAGHDPSEMHSYIEHTYSISALADRSLDAFYSLISERQGK